MAKGIETLAGPVSENDVIMRENEAPMGAAALMNKQVRKSVPGFYKLPSQKDDTPEFMKAAKAGVDQDMAQMDTISTMAGALMREGVDTRQMNPDQIIMLYEQMMGSVGDRDQFGITDATDALNDMAPDGEKLAYINPEEAGILAMLGGAGEMTPQGIPSFRIAGNFRIGDTDYSSPSQSDMNKEKDPAEQRRQAAQSMASVGLQSAGDVVSSKANQQQKIINYYQDRERDKDDSTGGMSNQLAQVYGQTAAARGKEGAGSVSFDPKTATGKRLIQDSGKNLARDIITSSDPLQALKDNQRAQEIFSLMGDYTPLTGNIGFEDLNLLGAFKALTKGGLGKKKKDRLTRKDKDGEDTDEMTKEGFYEKLGDIEGGRDIFNNLIKRYDTQNYYRVAGMPQTTGGLEEMVQFGKVTDTTGMDRDSKEYKEAKKFNNQLFAAREYVQEKRSRNDQQQSGGGFTQPAMPGDTTTVTPSEDAYKFNVGGTMPYTDDVLTGGKEMQVPVGKRMQLDSTGAMKTQPRSAADLLNIATQGGGFNQLEDFNNYIKRRRKFLGEEEPEYFDEDGNVIMAGLGKAKTV